MILRLILGDQLNEKHSWFNEVRGDVLYVMMETRSETDYVAHHIQKVAAFFAAMRHFAALLQAKGHRVRYFHLDDADNTQSFTGNSMFLAGQTPFQRIECQQPDEYRLDAEFKSLAEHCQIPVQIVDSEHFLTPRYAVGKLFAGRKMFLMETFYRHVRQKYGLLMDGGKPEGGTWNFDGENRKKLPARSHLPDSCEPENDVAHITEMLGRQGVETIGGIDPKKLPHPVTRTQALAVLEHFTVHLLPNFGSYQDAMTTRHKFLYHSRLSFALNVKLLHPLEVVNAAIERWRTHPEHISLPQVEGFVRQIIGWREYMRGMYWHAMPAFATKNYLNHTAPLPGFYWNGDTKMNCVRHAVRQSLDDAYAHHIQRLMVTGNFALLAGVNPDELDAWYLGIYIDAIEWVEITNTRGMSQFADGGLIGTKPYVSSANYIDKMSDYCATCAYDKQKRHGENACPFNSLYWHFYERHRDKLARNPRIGMAYRMLDSMEPAEKQATMAQAAKYLADLDKL